MDNQKKIEELIIKSQIFFVENLQTKICKAISDLAHFNLSGDNKLIKEINIFFHSLNGTANTLKLNRISKIGKKYEDMISEGLEKEDKTVIVSVLFFGLSSIIIEHEALKEKFDLKNQSSITFNNYLQEEADNKESKGNLLIIDDDESILFYISSYLNSKGYVVNGAKTIREAFEVIEKEAIEIILSDIMLEGKNGIETYLELTENKKDIPVIFITGISKIDEKLKSKKLNYIKKPIDLLELVKMIEKVKVKVWDESDFDKINEEIEGVIKDSEYKIKKRKKLLIIDDDESFVNFLKMVLEDEYLVEVSNDGDSGLIKTIEIKPDFILLDVMLPKVDGFRVLRTLKNNVENFNSKIIVISSKNRNESIIKAFELGADDFISKPIEPNELLLRLMRLK